MKKIFTKYLLVFTFIVFLFLIFIKPSIAEEEQPLCQETKEGNYTHTCTDPDTSEISYCLSINACITFLQEKYTEDPPLPEESAAQEPQRGIQCCDANKKYDVNLEGYYKTYEKLPIFDNSYNTNEGTTEQSNNEIWQSFGEAKGYSFGGEILIEKNEGYIDGSISYSLGYAILNNDSTYYANWDKRHSFKAVLR